MACTSITDVVVKESGRFLPGEIFRRNFGVAHWMTLMPRGVYPAGLGETINVLTYERTAPVVAEPTWTQSVAVAGMEGGLCLPTPDEISVGSTVRNFSLFTRAIHGPPFCAENLRSVFELQQQLNAISAVLAEYSRIEWEIRDRHEYFRQVQTKVVVNSCTTPTEDTTQATSYPVAQATLPLSMAVLDRYRIQLLRDGAAGSALVRSNGMPILTVICSHETAGNIIRQNFTERQDIQYADSTHGDAARLLKAFGIQHEYRGFMFLVDMFPRRFTYSGGYTEVPAFVQNAATNGFKSDINPAYRTAPYEETVIFDPMVMTQLVPTPITNPAPNFRFDPVTYTGDWKVLNILNEQCNPDGTILRHRGLLKAGSMPVHPERGVAFVHLRCDPSGCVTSCAS